MINKTDYGRLPAQSKGTITDRLWSPPWIIRLSELFLGLFLSKFESTALILVGTAIFIHALIGPAVPIVLNMMKTK